MSFILQKAVPVQTGRTRGFVFLVLALALGAVPQTAMARENEQAEVGNCPGKAQRRIVRQMTEPTPIRKKDKDRVRRILM
jgi:hypothetical protein